MRHVWQWGVLTLFVGACGFSGGGADGLPANCQAGTLICDGEVSKTCGTNGEWDPALDRTCDLACSAGVCITASNVPMARVLACGADAPALKPPAGATVTLGPGTPGIPGTAASLQCNPDCGRPGVTVIESSPMIEAGDVDLAWFCLSELSLAEGVTLNLFDRALTTPYAIAIGVAGEATLRGEVDLTGAAATSANRGLAGPGGGAGSSQSDSDGGSGGGGVCGGKGGLRRNGTLLAAGGGGGGGGHGMDGGAGGSVSLTCTSSTRARDGPRHSAASNRATLSDSPSATASTRPSDRFRTQPPRPSRVAASTVNQRKPTPCTRPATTK